MKSVLWRVAKRMSYIEDAWCLKVKTNKSAAVKAQQILSVPSIYVTCFGRTDHPQYLNTQL